MNRLKWISSQGGPLVVVTEDKASLWNGIYKQSVNADQTLIAATDFLDPYETDYGRACSIGDYIGALEEWNGDTVVVLGDEPTTTSILKISTKEIFLIRVVYCESLLELESILLKCIPNKIMDWEFNFSFFINSNNLVLFDSAVPGRLLEGTQMDKVENIESGTYDVFTSIFEPNDEVKTIIHKFKQK